jgi:hypothetical protein
MTAQEKAKAGLWLLKQAVLDYLATKPQGAQAFEVSEGLGLASDGQFKVRHTLSVLRLLVNEKNVRYEAVDGHRRYFLARQPEAAA